MSKEIDSKVVEMTFDNSNFEKNVSESMSTLDKLNSKLKLSGATEGLEDIASAAKKIDLSGLSSSAETVELKFAALAGITTGAFAMIGNQAVVAGEKIVKSFALDPIIDGFHEYETQLNSVQTILANTASKGSTIDDVNDALNELNTYADKTIYNFTEMTRNIGTFTAAGVDLKKSTEAIKGIANLAAVSGSTSQQASTAMYQLSQAIAAGTVKLQDWNSVVNAGMGGETFQKALERTAKHFGVDVDAMIKKAGSFRESLQKGWISSDVLTETLKQISGAYSEADLIAQGYSEDEAKAIYQLGVTATNAATKVKTFSQLVDTTKEAVGSGWTETWQIVFGDFESARNSWTRISDSLNDIVQNISDARNNFLKNFLGGALDSKWSSFTGKLKDAGIDTAKYEEAVVSSARDSGIAIDDLMLKYGSLQGVVDAGALSADVFTKALDSMGSETTAAQGSTENMTDALGKFQKVVDDVWYGSYGNGADRVKKLTDAGYDYAKVQELVNKTVDGHRLTLEDLGEEQAKAIGMTDDQISALKNLQEEAKATGTPISELIQQMTRPTGRELIVQTFTNALTAMAKPIRAIRDGIGMAFKPNSEALYGFLSRMRDVSEGLIMSDEAAGNLRDTFGGLLKVVRNVGDFFGGFASTSLSRFVDLVSPLLKNTGNGLLGITGDLGRFLSGFSDAIDAGHAGVYLANSLFDAIERVIDLVSGGFHYLTDLLGLSKQFQKFGDILSGTLGEAEGKNAAESFKKGFNSIKWATVFDSLKKAAAKVIKNLQNLDWDRVGKAIKSGFETGAEYAKRIDIRSILGGIKNSFQSIVEYISGLDWSDPVNAVSKALADARQSIDEFGKDVKEKADNLIQGFVNGIQNGDVKSALISFAKSIISTVCAVLGIHSPSTVFFEIGQNVVRGLSNGISSMLGSMDDSGASLANALADSFSNSVTNIDWGSIAILAVAGSFAYGANQLKKAAANFALPEKIVNGWLGMGKSISGFFDTMSKYFKGTKFTNITRGMEQIAIAIAILSGSLALLSKMDQGNLLSAVGALSLAIGVLSGCVVGLTFLAKKMDDVDVSKIAAFTIALSAAFLIMSKAVATIAGVDWAGIAKSAVMFGIFGILIAAIIKISGKLKPASKTVGEIAKLSLAMSVSFLIMALAVKALGQLDPTQLAQGLFAITAFTALIAALMVVNGLITKYGGYAATEGLAKSLIGISAAMAVMSLCVKYLGEMDADQLSNGMTAIREFFAFIIVYMAVSALLGKLDSKSDDPGEALIKIAAAIAIMSLCVKVLGEMDAGALDQGLAAIGGFFLLIMSYQAISKLLGTIDGQASDNGSELIKMAAAIAIMTLCVKALGDMDVSQIVKGELAIAGLMGLILIYSKLASKISETASADPSDSILKMAAALTLMTWCVKIIADMDAASIFKGIAVLAAFGALLVGILAMANALNADGATINTSATTLLAVAVSVGILAFVAKMLGDVQTENLVKGITAVGFLSAFMMGLMAVAKFATGSEKTIIAIAIAIGVLAVATAILSMIDVDALARGITAVGLLTVFMDSLLVCAQFAQGSLPTIIALVAAIAVIGVVIGVLSQLNPEGALQSAEAISMLMLSMSATFATIALVGPMASGAMAAIGPAIAVISAMTGLAVGLSLLASALDSALNGGLEAALDTGVMVAGKIGEMIGAFAGGIIGGLVDELPATADALNKFAISLGVFGASLMAIPTGLAAKATEIVTAVSTIHSINTGDGLFSGLTGHGMSMDQFGTELNQFAGYLVDFASQLSGVDLNALSIGSQAAQALADLNTSIHGSGGSIFDMFDENSDIDKFGDDIQAYADAIKKFASSVSGFSGESSTVVSDTQVVSDVTKALASLNDNMPTQGGLFSNIIGQKETFASFGDDISAYADSLVKYGQTVSGLSADGQTIKDDTDTVKNVTQSLGSLNDSMPTQGGLFSNIIGQKETFKSFGEDICAYADSLVNFGEAVSVFSSDGSTMASDIDSAKTATESLVELCNSFPDSGGAAQFFAGSKSFSGFGNGLPEYGTALSDFASNVSGLDVWSVWNAKDASMSLVELASYITDSGVTGVAFAKFVSNGSLGRMGEELAAFSDAYGDRSAQPVWSAKDAAMSLVELACYIRDSGMDGSAFAAFANGDSLAQMGASLSLFAGSAEAIPAGTIQAAVDGAYSIVNFLQAASGTDFSAATGFNQAVQTLASSAIPQLIAVFSGAGPQLQSAGLSMMASVSAGISSGSGLISSAAMGAASSAASVASGYASVFGVAGTAWGISLSDAFGAVGIQSSTGQATNIAGQTISTLASATSTMQNVGASWGLAVANGILSMAGNARTAGQSLGSAAGSGISSSSGSGYRSAESAGEYIAQGLIDGMDARLSSVRSKAAELSSAATGAIASAAQIGSPSKITIKYGKWIAEGLGIGMDKKADYAVKSGRDLASSALQALSDSMSDPTYLNEFENLDPTITPIVDLSNVASSARMATAMLSGLIPAGTVETASSIGNSVDTQNQNGSISSQILDALRESLASRDTSNGPTVVIDGNTVNDTDAIQQATEDYILRLVELGALNNAGRR